MVTVEYHDPSGIFALLNADLLSRLPLRNLNWKSPSRPLRNIDTVRVEFVPDKDTIAGNAGGNVSSLARSSSVRSAKKDGASDSIWGGRPDAGHRSISQPIGVESPAKERRHQIPGLRETPYLKLFILRCDDKEAYRLEARQQLRDWVKNISPKSTQSTTALNRHDNHDAYEWMIIHVVIPDTPAASEPRWTAAKNDPDELAERSKSKTKWTSKGTSTVFDKIRADFHPATKSALERVAQIRLPKNTVPPSFLPKVPVPSQLSETSQEQENAWQDLVAKFKTLILQSFDYRVAQYEEDVREKEAQRALPGWNFSTFFTLKEGLAKAFESVGLVEDALAIYDELAAGLDATTSDNTAFLGDMTSLRRELMSLASSSTDHEDSETRRRMADLLASPLDVNQKDYRGLIVSSTISLFDFHIYIFARQRLLIYRLGAFTPQDAKTSEPPTPQSAVSTATDKTTKAKSDTQLSYVAEVCRRASAFLSSNARTLGKELETSSALIDQMRYESIVQSVSASWAFTTADKVLAETSVSLYYSPSTATTPRDGGFNFPQGANSFPTRRSSLAPTGKRNSVVVYENEKYTPNDGDIKAAPAGSGLAELAACRGELCILQRRFLEMLASKKGWRAGWNALGSLTAGGQNGSLLDHTTSLPADDDTASFLDEELLAALRSEEAFRSAYEELTDLAIRHLMLGNRLSNVEGLMGDLALLKYQKGDMTGAAQILQKLVPKYMNGGWGAIESGMVWLYTNCLKLLNRRDEYVRLSLALLNRTSENTLQGNGHSKTMSRQQAQPQVSMHELAEYSNDFTTPFRSNLDNLFSDMKIDQAISHAEDKDGFSVRLSYTSHMTQDLTINAIKVKMTSVTGSGQDIWLQSDHHESAIHGSNSTTISTTVSAFGLYSVQQIVFEIGKLHFARSYEAKPKSRVFSLTDSSNVQTKAPSSGTLLMVFPRAQSLEVSISMCPDIHIDNQRSLHVRIDAGDQEASDLTLRFRPSTAGLRLHTADAKVVEGGPGEINRDASGALKISLQAGQTLVTAIPYSLDVPQPDLSMKVEAVAKREGKDYTFLFDDEISTDLLLDVDVNDIFKVSDLFSRFSIRSTSEDPFLLQSIELQGSKDFTVDLLDCPENLPVFGRQPASLACRIWRTTRGSEDEGDRRSSALQLRVHYASLVSWLVDSTAADFDATVSDSAVAHLRRLLLPLLKDQLTACISTESVERGFLLSEIDLPSFADMGWTSILGALPRQDRQSVEVWLTDWHDKHKSIPFNSSEVANTHTKTLTIPVDIPSIDILANASLKVQSASTSPSLPPTATVGQPLPLTLSVSYTHNWGSKAKPSSSTTDLLSPDTSAQTHKPRPQATFTYSIPDSQDWLIAGPTTATFTLNPATPTTFPLLLIPLVPGTLLLPTVEITLAEPQRIGDTPLSTPISAAPSSAGARTVLDTGSLSRYACEVDYESAAETVLVLRAEGDVDISVLDGVSTSYMSPPAGQQSGQVGGQEGRASMESRVQSVELKGLWLH